METESLQSEKDKMLWKQAKKRVGFRSHLITYLAVNTMLWLMWLIGGKDEDHHQWPWPLFCSLGWGFGIFWHFLGAFVLNDKVTQVEKEFNKLKQKQNN